MKKSNSAKCEKVFFSNTLKYILYFVLTAFSYTAFSAEKTTENSIIEDMEQAFEKATTEENTAQEKTTIEKDAVQGNVVKIKVTGSRIKRIDMVGANPNIIYNKEDLENSGYSSAGDFLRDTNVSHFGVSREKAGVPTSGESFAALKGEISLILINGVRVAEDPSGQAVDLNLIPMFAIQRVEVLKDGGSAIYGSDAVGGVINFITKKEFSGIEFHAQIAPTVPRPNKGGSRGDLATVFGGGNKKGSYIGSIHFRFQDSVENYEREWTERIISHTGPYGVFDKQVDPKCPEALKTPSGCNYNAANHSTRLPQYGQLYTYFHGDYKFKETTFYTQLIGSYKNNKWTYAPIAGTLELPAGHQMSLGTGQKGELKYRFLEAGPRDTTNHNFIGDWTLGAKGWLSPTWDYDISLKLAHIIKNNTSGGLLLKKEIIEAIVNGTYDPFNPEKRDLSTAQYTAKSSNDSSLILSSADFSGESGFGNVDLATGFQAYFKNYDQNADKKAKEGKILSNASGDGYGDRYVLSYYLEGIKSFSDALEIQLAGRADIYSDSTIQDSAENSEDSANKKSLPFDFKNRTQRATVNPKLAFRFKPHPQFLLRGSLGRAFVAPSLEALNQAGLEGYPYIFDTVACYNELKSKKAFDPVYEKLADKSDTEKDEFIKDFLIEQTEVINQKNLSAEVKTELENLSKSFPTHEYCKGRQVFVFAGGNKKIKETAAWVASLGSHLQIADEHSLTLDIWYIRKNGVPRSGIDKKTLDAELKYGLNYVKEKSDGNITIKRSEDDHKPLKSGPEHGITSKLLNLGSTQTSGFEFIWDSNMSNINVFGGTPYFQDTFSYIFFSKAEDFPGIGYVNRIGKWGSPRWRNHSTLGWKNKQHNLSLTAHTVSSFAKSSSELENLPIFTRWDLDYQFIISSKATFKFSWSNLLLSSPPIDEKASNNKIDHDIFEARGPFIVAGFKYKI